MPPDRVRPPAEILYPVVQNATENPASGLSFRNGVEDNLLECHETNSNT